MNVDRRLSDEIVDKVYEIYDNAFHHANSPVGVISCGQYYKSKNEIRLTVIDFGVGIPSKVGQFLNRHDLSAADTLRWAFKRGTTTKPSASKPGGLGLDFLKEFIQLNHGFLEIYSGGGFARIDANGEHYFNRTLGFGGTMVNITLICDDKNYRIFDGHVDDSSDEIAF